MRVSFHRNELLSVVPIPSIKKKQKVPNGTIRRAARAHSKTESGFDRFGRGVCFNFTLHLGSSVASSRPWQCRSVAFTRSVFITPRTPMCGSRWEVSRIARVTHGSLLRPVSLRSLVEQSCTPAGTKTKRLDLRFGARPRCRSSALMGTGERDTSLRVMRDDLEVPDIDAPGEPVEGNPWDASSLQGFYRSPSLSSFSSTTSTPTAA
eukprot:g29617.t1